MLQPDRGSVERGSGCAVDLHVHPAVQLPVLCTGAAMHLNHIVSLATSTCSHPCCAPESLPLPPVLQVTYPAELAGLHYGVRSTVAGLLITVYGYSDTLATLAQV